MDSEQSINKSGAGYHPVPQHPGQDKVSTIGAGPQGQFITFLMELQLTLFDKWQLDHQVIASIVPGFNPMRSAFEHELGRVMILEKRLGHAA
jgi:hypothetical protein